MSAQKLGKQIKTDGGFPAIFFDDFYGQKCAMEASTIILPHESKSAMDKPGTSAIWLGVAREDMHLSRSQVEALVTHLQTWLKTGQFEQVIHNHGAN